MRSLFTVLLFALFGQDPSLRDLVQKLEDDSVESRERAQRELTARGESAIPALREVVDSTRSSGELKLRAAATIREIELGVKAGKVYRDLPRLSVTATDAPLRDVLDDLSRRSGVPIDSAAVENAKVSLDVKDVTLMEALDVLCRGQAERTWEPKDDGVIRLARDRFIDYPASYSGPFRVRAQSINADRNNDFKARTVSVTLTLLADWDRRLKPSRIVELEVAKATDDLGTVLEASPVDANTFFRGPGVQLRVVGAVVQDGSDNSRSFLLRGIQPGATSVTVEGTARYTFPLDQREVRIDKIGPNDTKDLGDTIVSLSRNGTPENWTLRFFKPPSSTTPAWARSISQRFDPESFVVVEEDGAEFIGTMRPIYRGRQLQDNLSDVIFMGVVQRKGLKQVKEVKFRFVDQTLVKTAPFKFSTLALP